MSVFQIHFKLLFKERYIWLWGFAFGLVFSLVLMSCVFFIHYRNRFYQNIHIDQISVGGLTKAEAYEKLKHSYQQPSISGKIVINALDKQEEDHQQSLSLRQALHGKDYQEAIEAAFFIGRESNIFKNIATIIDLLGNPQNVEANYQFNQQLIRHSINELAQKVYDEGEPFAITLVTSGNPYSLNVVLGEDGWQLSTKETEEKIKNILDQKINQENKKEISQEIIIDAKTQAISQTLTEDEIEASKNRALSFLNTKIEFYGYDREVEIKDKNSPPARWVINKALNDQDIIQLLTWPQGISHQGIEDLIKEWAAEIDRPAQDAEFEYDPKTLKVSKFQSNQPGIELDQNKANTILITAIQNWDELAMSSQNSTNDDEDANNQTEQSLNKIKYLTLKTTQPKTVLADTNDLGINTLIGFGESFYYGSIAPRLHNIKVSSEKLNLTLIPPGEKFFFNQVVGEVNHTTGFQQAYVIRSGRTIMEFGGGVCQVSTTMFRAMLDAGINITRRLPHSYRVRYYEIDNQPGFDATVYAGNVDLRFENNTPGYLLITAEADSAKAYMNIKIYGTDDGRKVEIKNYQKWGYTAPPPSQDIPDPSLAPGERRRVENAIPGLRTSFDWVVTDKDGQVLHEKTFYSHYQAWGEKWLVGI
jgi:hypothetical protein